MEISKNLNREEIEKKANSFMRGVDNHKIWGSHYIVLMDWTEYNVKEKRHEYLGVDLRLIPYDYSGGEYEYIAEAETFGKNRYSDKSGDYYDKSDVAEMIVNAIMKDFEEYKKFTKNKGE
mgnify:FL=1